MDHSSITFIDFGIIGLYLVFMMVIGIWFIKKVKGQDDFYVAGRTLGPVVIMATVCATIIGGSAMMGRAAKAYNEGGYSSIYLDALDGISKHCDDPSEVQYYMAAFVCEVLKYCKKEPLLEASCHYPILWTSRGRIGAWDTCKQGLQIAFGQQGVISLVPIFFPLWLRMMNDE